MAYRVGWAPSCGKIFLSSATKKLNLNENGNLSPLVFYVKHRCCDGCLSFIFSKPASGGYSQQIRFRMRW